MRDHGGDLGAAVARHGGIPGDWIDLSTGINRLPYDPPAFAAHALRDLPPPEDVAACAEAARRAYGVAEAVDCLPLAGAQAAIQLLPRLRPPGRAAVLGPTYNEHAAAFAAAGWTVADRGTLEELAGFDAVVVVNPNNPDGRRWPPEAISALTASNGLVVVDESFADVAPEVSVAAFLGRPGLVALRSFGKFFGLAGLRLGFALGARAEIARLRDAAGPWSVAGPALAAGRMALDDAHWIRATRARLGFHARRLDQLAAGAGWTLVGGTGLFRLYDTPDAAAAQDALARHRIWSRRFPYSDRWLRLGLPGPEAEWHRVAEALTRVAADRCP